MVFDATDVSVRGTHLLAFADGSALWRRAGRRFAAEAAASGLFTQVTVCEASTLTALDPRYVDRRQALFADGSPGFGCYAWKPFLLSHYLALPSLRADRVAYVDVGCHLNIRPAAVARWREHERWVDDHGLLALHMPGRPEEEWTKPLVLDHFGLDAAQRQSPQVLGGVLVVANDDHGRELVSEWDAAMIHAGGTLARDPAGADEAGQHLRAHRHDQSVLSCLLKSRGVPTVTDETYFAPDWESGGADYPVWALRNRSGIRYRRHRRVFHAAKAAEHIVLATRRPRPHGPTGT